MTATLDRPTRDRPPVEPPERQGRTGVWLTRVRQARRNGLPEHWPFTFLVAGFGLWWAIGFGAFAVTAFAVPMAWKLRKMRPIRVPRGFGLWLLFLLAVLVSGLMLGKTAPDTLPDSVGGQIFGYGLRYLAFLAAAVTLLFVGNLGQKGLPERVILGSLAVLFLTTVAGGLLGMAMPYFEFKAPLEWILPRGIASNSYVRTLVRPGAAQVQDVLGYTSPRPKAPFEYTNTWGNVIGLLTVWFVAWAVLAKSRVKRLAAATVIAVALVPIVFSLNRGLWVGLGLAVLIVCVRLLFSGRIVAVLGLSMIGMLLAVVFVSSPLETIVEERLANPHSNDIRSNLADAAIRGATQSPAVGWGTSRQIIGSFQSIAVGDTDDCEGRCGNPGIGSTGTFWLVTFAHGFVGISLYVGFFLAILWFYRGDRSIVGIVAQMTILMSMWFMFVYSAVGWPLTINMIAAALLWRHQVEGVPVDDRDDDAVPA